MLWYHDHHVGQFAGQRGQRKVRAAIDVHLDTAPEVVKPTVMPSEGETAFAARAAYEAEFPRDDGTATIGADDEASAELRRRPVLVADDDPGRPAIFEDHVFGSRLHDGRARCHRRFAQQRIETLARERIGGRWERPLDRVEW